MLPPVIGYIGDTRSHELVARIKKELIPQMIQRGRLNGRRSKRWAFDNGAYSDWVNGKPFRESKWRKDIDAILRLPTRSQPDFAVLPDIVAGGKKSLDSSLGYLEEYGNCLAWYLAVQDGMVPGDIPDSPWLSGIFVGGTTAWKLRTIPMWVATANSLGYLVHVGRCGSMRRIRLCRESGVASIDSCSPLYQQRQWDQFFAELRSKQQCLFGHTAMGGHCS
jgi:hypothetical protein